MSRTPGIHTRRAAGLSAPRARGPAGSPPRPARRTTVAVAVVSTGLAWVGIMLTRLFVGGAVGMGDQGDGRRLLCQLGVRATVPFNADPSSFAYPTWVAHHWFGEACSADGAGSAFRSSQLWMLSMARHLTPILGLPGTLDLRAQGVICAVLVGVVVAALVAFAPGRLWLRVLIASLIGLLAADGMVADFFISPYTEPAELIATLALCPALLAMWRRGHTTWPSVAAVGFLGIVAIGAKPQAAALLPGLILALLWLPHQVRGAPDVARASQHRWRRAHPWLAGRVPGLTVALLLVGATAYFVDTVPAGLAQQDVYAEVFGEILPHSPDPAGDLRSLGADPRLASAVSTNPESPNSAARRIGYLRFRTEVTETKIVEFYLTHPTRLAGVGADGLKGVAQWRQNYLGSYSPHSGHPPGAIESRVDAYGTVLHHAWEPMLVLVWLLTLYVGVRTARRADLGPGVRAVGALAVFATVGSFFELWAVMISEGFADVYRHMALTNLLLALGLPLLIACAALRLRVQWRTGIEPPPGPSQPTHGVGAGTDQALRAR